MALEPNYGQTLVAGDEADALTQEARDLLGEPIHKADLYDLEQQIQSEVADEWWSTLLNRNIPIRDLLDDHFVRELHRRLYAPVWEWGGRQRALETNIGVAPENIAVEMRNALDDLIYQWENEDRVDARGLGIATHAALVRIHPFADGNGRVTRLLADLVFIATQTGLEPLLAYDWEVDRQAYIHLLREYDRSRDPTSLTHFIPVVSLED